MFENMYGALQGGVLSPDLFEVLLSDTSANLDSVHVSDIQIPYLLYMPTKTEVVVWVTVTSSLRNIFRTNYRFHKTKYQTGSVRP